MFKLSGTHSRYHEVRNHERYVWFNLFGSYPGHFIDQKSIKRYFLNAKAQGKKFIIHRSSEPNVLWNGPQKKETIFDFIHDTCVEINYPASNVLLVSGNYHVKEVYENWCKTYSIANPISVMPSYHWITRARGGTFGKEHDHYNNLEDTIRSRYFTCFNGRARAHKVDVARYFYATKFFEKDLAYFSFVFPDGEPISEKFFKEYPAIESVLPRSIENNTKRHISGDWYDVPRAKFMDTMKMKLVQRDTYFDLVVDFMQHEDYEDYDNYVNFKNSIPWWKEAAMSEKVVKNICNRKPFLYLGEPHMLKLLHDMGFKTFDMIFNEDYDWIEDYSIRYLSVLSEAESITKTYTLKQMHDIFYSDEVREVVEHNYKQLAVVEEQYVRRENAFIKKFSL